MSRADQRDNLLQRVRRWFGGAPEPPPEATGTTLFTATLPPPAPQPRRPDPPLFEQAPAMSVPPVDEPQVDEPQVDEPQVDEPLFDPPTAPTHDHDDDLSIAALTDELSRLAVDEDDHAPPAARPTGHQVPDRAPVVSVHDERLDERPGPIRMTPSEAVALAKDGPGVLRRWRPSS